ncbi:YciI family protein [Variovorax saccharolyticus]|uniref:YciI family protein n=1 Tax=Variovorax saccharolyticus TaxID=3053516 RepID=UPI0025779598|nr:YciI family protein [Variovorax sp. J22R187]MDM0019446.1 YciI family protein [Variovorax sp. J22R187]
MKYLCLIYVEEALLDALSDAASAALAAESMACQEELASRGQLVAGHALQRGKRAKVVALRSGRMSRRDGPFVDAKEQLGGFVLIEAGDLNAAIRIASGIPLARVGSIEVRPIAKVDRMEASTS